MADTFFYVFYSLLSKKGRRMEMGSILFIIDLLIGLWLIHILRKRDIYSPEPYKYMLIATVFGGTIAVLITLTVSGILHQFGLYTQMSVLNFFVFTGPIEEISKLLGFLLFIKTF